MSVAGVSAVIGPAGYAVALADVSDRAREPHTTPVLAVETLPDPTTVLPRTAIALPPITFDPAMVMFGDEYTAPLTYNRIANELLFAPKVEAEILRRRDADLLRAVDHGNRLDQMRQAIADATNGWITTSAYTFASMHFHPVLRGGQSGSVIGVDASGVERVVVYDARGGVVSEREVAVSLSIAVREGIDHRWVIVDLR